MSPQLQQVLAEVDRLLLTEQIQIVEYINTRQRNSVLENITNLRSKQTAFKTPEQIDAEIFEEKASWTNLAYYKVVKYISTHQSSCKGFNNISRLPTLVISQIGID